MELEDLVLDSPLDDNGRLTLAYRGLSEIPEDVSKKFAKDTRELDLSFNNFSNLHSLKDFSNIHTLILDNNDVKSCAEFPHLPKLTTLWLNKNKISDLGVFVNSVSKAYPKLKYLSFINNLAAPSYFNEETQQEYAEYRQFIVSRFSELVVLDHLSVKEEERAETETRQKRLNFKGGLSTTANTRDLADKREHCNTIKSNIELEDSKEISGRIGREQRALNSQQDPGEFNAETTYQQRLLQIKKDDDLVSNVEDSKGTDLTDGIQFGDLTAAQSEAVCKTFRRFGCKSDIDKIRSEDFRKVMSSFGFNISDNEAIEMKAEIDPEDTGKLDIMGFQKVLSKKMSNIDVGSDIKEAFWVFDKDGDGTIPISEFKFIMKAAVSDVPEEELEAMINDMDVDGDGEIDYQEFADLVKVGRNFMPAAVIGAGDDCAPSTEMR